MISFIIDGYDPWTNVEKLLERISLEIAEPCQVILMASFLLDVPAEVCASRGKELFGASFSLLGTDDISVFRARIRAQQEAGGDIFVYLSPAALPDEGTITNLVSGLRSSGCPCVSASLSFRYSGVGTERFLACGYALGHDGRLVPALTGCNVRMFDNTAFFDALFPSPYCFCSSGPFYAIEDEGANFWQSHINAAEKAGSQSRCAAGFCACMHPESFSPYHAVISRLFTGRENVREAASENGFSFVLSPYGRGLLSPCREWHDASAGMSEESIFWSMLVTQLPEFIAAASRMDGGEPLRFLARETLMEMSSMTWSMAREKAQHLLGRPVPGGQSFGEWEKICEPLSGEIYAAAEPSFREAIKNAAGLKTVLSNLACILRRGLLGRRG